MVRHGPPTDSGPAHHERVGARGDGPKRWLAGGLVFGGFEDAGGALEVADVADDLVDLGFGDAGDGEHVAEGPVVLTDAAKNSEMEGGIAMVARVVDAVDKGGAEVGAGGFGAVALGAVGVEDGFALSGCLV